ncbi:MAG: ATP-grasp domain-containing protein [Bacillota bacterium]
MIILKKKILILGGGYFQTPIIKLAKKEGHYVITCGYKPNNPGHKYADEYYNVSTINKEEVLELAQRLDVDGILTYASDVSAPTVAYVGNKLNLPSNPYESVVTLTTKDLYREFLSENDFNVPRAESFEKLEIAKNQFDKFKPPVMVKPVDSAGTKGVSKINREAELKEAFEYARSYSIQERVIIEEFIEKTGYQIAGDGFVCDGDLVFRCFANEHFDKLGNSFVPIGESFPYTGGKVLQQKVHKEIQRALDLLNIKFGALNFDIRIDKDENVYLMEIGPRNGGNLIPKVIRYATGVDLIKATIDTALGLDCSDLKMEKVNGYYSSYIIHATDNGILDDVIYSDEIKNNILEKDLFVDFGEKVKSFNHAGYGLGAMVLEFNSQLEMIEKMDNMEQYLNVKLK